MVQPLPCDNSLTTVCDGAAARVATPRASRTLTLGWNPGSWEMAVKPAGVGTVDVPDATVVVVLVVAVSVSVDVVVIVALCVSIRDSRQSLFEACIDLSLLVTVVVTLPVSAGAVVVVVTTIVLETVVVTAFGVVVVSGVEVTRAVVVRVRVRA